MAFPEPPGPFDAYTLVQYKTILDGIITVMTAQFKVLIPTLEDMVAIAYTVIKDNKLYVTLDFNIVNAVWLEGNGITVEPVYTNTDLSLDPQEIVDTWGESQTNILTLKNY